MTPRSSSVSVGAALAGRLGAFCVTRLDERRVAPIRLLAAKHERSRRSAR
jgi:hypothetical protein